MTRLSRGCLPWGMADTILIVEVARVDELVSVSYVPAYVRAFRGRD